MKRYILLTAILLCGIALSWGQAIGSWKAYPALQISNYNEPVGDRIYSLCNHIALKCGLGNYIRAQFFSCKLFKFR